MGAYEMSRKGLMKTRTLVTAALLVALGVMLNFINFPILPAPADFLKYTPADIPTLLGSFALGPIVGSVIAVSRAILHSYTPASSGGPIGTVMDALTSVSFVGLAGVIYYFKRTRKGAVLGLAAATICVIVVSTVLNYFWAFPAYGAPADLVWATALPFNALKYSINAVLTFLLYKPLSVVLHGRRD